MLSTASVVPPSRTVPSGRTISAAGRTAFWAETTSSPGTGWSAAQVGSSSPAAVKRATAAWPPGVRPAARKRPSGSIARAAQRALPSAGDAARPVWAHVVSRSKVPACAAGAAHRDNKNMNRTTRSAGEECDMPRSSGNPCPRTTDPSLNRSLNRLLVRKRGDPLRDAARDHAALLEPGQRTVDDRPWRLAERLGRDRRPRQLGELRPVSGRIIRCETRARRTACQTARSGSAANARSAAA